MAGLRDAGPRPEGSAAHRHDGGKAHSLRRRALRARRPPMARHACQEDHLADTSAPVSSPHGVRGLEV